MHCQNSKKASIILKPSQGHFENYNFGDDLHIGIESNNCVYSFWNNGIEVDSLDQWKYSIIVLPLSIDNIDSHLSNFISMNNHRFQAVCYLENEWNCFDFVIEFMLFLGYKKRTKEEFLKEIMSDVSDLLFKIGKS
uniref:MKRN2 opposite strand protein-like C-terminal domain-containing protein n=1 Tax=Acrobeloides nanus TaxID=290746 RepID=A0A914D2J4_9BILA